MESESVRLRVTTRLCAGEGCRARERQGRCRRLTEGPSHLCAPCRGHLVADLNRLPGLYQACAEILGGSRPPGGLRERTSGGALPGLPFNTAAADARAATVAVLGSWAGLIVQKRRVHPPSRTVDALAAFLIRHSDWLCTHSTAGDASREVARLTRRAQNAVDPAHRRVSVGRCPESGCGGILRTVVHPSAPAGSGQIRCDVDPAHLWSGHQWAQLGQRLRGTGSLSPAWLTAADISRLWNIPTGSVYRLASEGQWRRRSRRGRKLYHEDDVLQSLDKHHPRSA